MAARISVLLGLREDPAAGGRCIGSGYAVENKLYSSGPTALALMCSYSVMPKSDRRE